MNGIIFAQDYSKSLADIKVKLINGSTISVVNHNLDLNRFSKVIHQELTKNGSQGILLHFTGANINNIIINYKYSENPRVSSDSENNISDLNGSAFTFKKKDSAELYLWIGDSLNCYTSYSDEHFSKICSVYLVYN